MNQLYIDEPVVYMQQRKSNPTVTLLVWLLKHPELRTLLDNSEYKGDMFNDMQTLQGPHSLTLCPHPLPNNYR